MPSRPDTAVHERASAAGARAARRALLEWYDESARDLPWRRRRDPWRVWVSEIMLQQTRAAAVVEPYERFLRRFPTVEAMAKSREEDVVAEWSGLGYYRRARSLHAGARWVSEQHAGVVPRTRDALERIPGIGAYTAGAILSLAFGEREAAIDANVQRVVARLAGIADVDAAEGRARVAAAARALVDCDRPGDVNEALMDVGSAVCTARTARCDECPLARTCHARRSGVPLDFAMPKPKAAARDVRLACAVVSDGERVLVLKRPGDDRLLGGMWELPTVDGAGALRTVRRELAELVRLRAGIDIVADRALFDVRHDIVGRRIVATVHSARISGALPRRLPDGARMYAHDSDPGARRDIPLSALPAKILGKLKEAGEPAASASRGSDVRARRSIGPMRSRAARGAA